MSAASGFQPFPSNAKPVLADLKSLNPSLVVRGGADLTGGFSDRSTVLLSRAPDLFAGAGMTLAGAIDGEAPTIGSRLGSLGVCQAVPVQAALPEKPASGMVTVNRPEWLPAGWSTGIKVRTSGATAGARDKYFYDPVSNRRFRSKKEVLSFLQTGKLGRYKPKVRKESDAPLTDKDLSAGLNSRRKRIDFFSRPSKVRWVLDEPNGSWTPFIGDEELSESTKRAWMDAFDLDGDEMDAFQEYPTGNNLVKGLCCAGSLADRTSFFFLSLRFYGNRARNLHCPSTQSLWIVLLEVSGEHAGLDERL